MNRQRGIAMLGILAIAAAVVAAAATGYHYLVVTGLKHEISTKQQRIEKLEGENAKLSAENTRLVDENKKAAALIDKQNESIKIALAERDVATAAYQAEKKRAAQNAAIAEQRAVEIRAFKAQPGEKWHDTWARQVKGYIVSRKAEVAQ